MGLRRPSGRSDLVSLRSSDACSYDLLFVGANVRFTIASIMEWHSPFLRVPNEQETTDQNLKYRQQLVE